MRRACGASLLRQRYAMLQQEYQERLAPLQGEREGLWRAIERDLQERVEERGALGALVGKEAQELGAGLYNSQRDYLQQLEAYRAFRGKSEREGHRQRDEGYTH